MLTSSQSFVLLLAMCVFVDQTQAVMPTMGFSKGVYAYHPQMVYHHHHQQQQQQQRAMVGGASMKPMIGKALLKKALLKKLMLAKLALGLVGGKLMQAKSGMDLENDKIIDLSGLADLGGLLGAEDSHMFKRTLEPAAPAPSAAAVEEPQQQAKEGGETPVAEAVPKVEEKSAVEAEQQQPKSV